MAFDNGPESDEPPTEVFKVSLTELVTRTFTIWTRKIVSYVVIGAMFFAFILAIAVTIGLFVSVEYFVTDMGSFFAGVTAVLYGYTLYDANIFFSVSLVVILITLVLTTLATGAIIKFALDDYGYKKADVSASLSAAVASFVTLFLVLLITQILNSVFAGPMLFFTEIAMDVSDPLNPVIADEFALNMMLVMAAMMVIVFYITVRIIVTSAVVMAEGASVMDAFKRSFELTKGNFFHTFLGILLIGIIVVILDSILIMFLGVFFASIINLLVLSSITYVFQAVLYKDLNARSMTSEQSAEWW